MQLIMLALALGKTFAVASRSSAPTITSAAAVMRHRSSLAFSILPSTRSSNSRCRLTNARMVSTADADIDSDSISSADLVLDQQPKKVKNALHTVMVHRNKQSASFREGTPLIFGGSVASTFTEYCGDATTDSSSIPMGSLVAVAVSRDAPPKTKSSKPKGRRDFRGRNNRRNSDSTDKKESAPVPHHTFSSADREAEHRDTITQSQQIGYGVFNPESMYRVRILCHDTMHPGLSKEIRSGRKQLQRGNNISSEAEENDNNDDVLELILSRKIVDAIYTRLAMNLPSSATDTYRLVNGEGDGLSGLAVDVLGGSTAIVMSSAGKSHLCKSFAEIATTMRS